MASSDPLADLLTKIRNAIRANKRIVEYPNTKMAREITRMLHENKFIGKYIIVEAEMQGMIKVLLKYFEGESVIQGITRVSKPSLRKYVKVDEIPRVKNGLGMAVLSTPRGIMTGLKAKKLGVGGEVLCIVW